MYLAAGSITECLGEARLIVTSTHVRSRGFTLDDLFVAIIISSLNIQPEKSENDTNELQAL